MKFKLLKKYLSLYEFESEDLANLSVIIGKNGSGKTQLLKIIESAGMNTNPQQSSPPIGLQTVSNKAVEITPLISNIQFIKFKVRKPILVDNSKYQTFRKNRLAQIYGGMDKRVVSLIAYIIINNLEERLNDIGRLSLLTEDESYKELLRKLNSQNARVEMNRSLEIQTYSRYPELKGLNKATLELWKIIIQASNGIEQASGTVLIGALDELKEAPAALVDNAELFNSALELIFYNYSVEKANRVLKKSRNANHMTELADQENLDEREPWIILNEMIHAAGLDFYFPVKELENFLVQTSLNLTLYKRSTDQIISFDDLSSGEEVILDIIVKCFMEKYHNKYLLFPELILLDEPDANLHPEMCKLLIDTLQNVFVKKLGIKVILTTHSATTIALAPEGSLFELQNGPNSALKMIKKDDALALYTRHLPISIDYRNHRQVFVESPVDRYYYQSLSDKLFSDGKLEHKIYFITNLMGQGNCGTVINLVNSMRNANCKSVFGIVDWDLKQNSSEHIFVHCQAERYSIENVVADPAYIIILLLTINAYDMHAKLNLSKQNHSYSWLFGDSASKQVIYDLFLSYFYVQLGTKRSEQIEVSYNEDVKLLVDKDYLTIVGHTLLDKIWKVFPALKVKYPTHPVLNQALAEIAICAYPHVPTPSIELIVKLSKGLI